MGVRWAASVDHGGVTRRFPDLDDADWLFEQYVTEGRSTSAIGSDLGCSGRAVRYALEWHDIPRRLPVRRSSRYWQLNDAQWLHRRYVVERSSLLAIARDVGCDRTTLRLALARHDIPIRPYPQA
jgi:hypothetical protein